MRVRRICGFVFRGGFGQGVVLSVVWMWVLVRVRRFWSVLGVGQGVVAVLNIIFAFLCLSCLWISILMKVETCIFWIGLTNCGNGSYLSRLFGVYNSPLMTFLGKAVISSSGKRGCDGCKDPGLLQVPSCPFGTMGWTSSGLLHWWRWCRTSDVSRFFCCPTGKWLTCFFVMTWNCRVKIFQKYNMVMGFLPRYILYIYIYTTGTQNLHF